jgi:hypothetical protein
VRLEIPLTGTIINEQPLQGDPTDPIRPVDLDLGNVSWRLLDVDVERGVAIIEVEPAKNVVESTTADGKPITRPATEQEQNALLAYAASVVAGYKGGNKLRRKRIG